MIQMAKDRVFLAQERASCLQLDPVWCLQASLLAQTAQWLRFLDQIKQDQTRPSSWSPCTAMSIHVTVPLVDAFVWPKWMSRQRKSGTVVTSVAGPGSRLAELRAVRRVGRLGSAM